MPDSKWIKEKPAAQADRVLLHEICHVYTPLAKDRPGVDFADTPLGEALIAFDSALQAFRAQLEPFPGLYRRVFEGSDDWTKLLSYKLLPHLAGSGCLIAAVAGGTNTGKSTVFNLLLGRDLSPVRNTAAATCRPLLAASAGRVAQCLEGKLVPEFEPMELTEPDTLLMAQTPPKALFVAPDDTLPDRLALLDIPDIDSIDRQNWEVAENIQAAGDVLVAVLTGEKYKDDRVVAFFRRAQAAGRVIVPLMNKANPEMDYAIARVQLADFCQSAGLDRPACFALPHDFKLGAGAPRPIESLNGEPDLRAYLESLDVTAIKERVFQDTVAHFAAQTGGFLKRVEETARMLHDIVSDLEQRILEYSRRYDPEPDAEVGELLHGFIQSRRGFISRRMGEFGGAVAQRLAPLGRRLGEAIRGRSILEEPEENDRAEAVRKRHREEIEILTRDFFRDLLRTARMLQSPADALVLDSLDALDVEDVVTHVTSAVLREDNVSEQFRAHVQRTLELWWNDNTLRRHLLTELDTLLVVSPTAIAVPLALFTGGIGVPEVMAVLSPAAGEFFARVMEYQLAEKWFDLVAPWRREQQAHFENALRDHVLRPALSTLDNALQPFDGPIADTLRRYQKLCRKVS
jgi:hypothetical protein